MWTGESQGASGKREGHRSFSVEADCSGSWSLMQSLRTDDHKAVCLSVTHISRKSEPSA